MIEKYRMKAMRLRMANNIGDYTSKNIGKVIVDYGCISSIYYGYRCVRQAEPPRPSLYHRQHYVRLNRNSK